MKTTDTKQSFQKNLNQDNYISKTGYRALFLLVRLLRSPMTRDEILECFQSDEIIKNTLSKDSVTNTINALRQAGCVISRPSIKTNNCYVIKSHPFLKSLLNENVEALQYIRDSLSSLGDWELILRLNSLYKKLSGLIIDEDAKNLLLYKHNLNNINLEILKTLLVSIKIKKYINLCYYSPKNGEENLDFLPESITLDRNKLYLWGYCQKYDEYAFIRIDRIRKINMINFLGSHSDIDNYEKDTVTVEYKLKNLSAIMFLENADEKIIFSSSAKDKEKTLIIRARVSNKFNFFQKILSYGTDCQILSPQEIVEEYKGILAKIKAGYKSAKK